MLVEIPDELYEKLLWISNEIATQSNRCTSDPYYYAIEEPAPIHKSYKNCFFTEKGIRRHMENQSHHYHNKARDYMFPAFRNPEMEAVFKLFRLLANKKEEQ